MADGTDRPAWSDISERLQNLRNLLISERHLGADQRLAIEALDREMDHMSADRSARERRRRNLDLNTQDNDTPAVSDTPPQTTTPNLVRSRRRAVRPSERLQRAQREALRQSARPAATEPYTSTARLSPASPSHSSMSDRGDRVRSKRRKLDDGTYDDEHKTFSYGHHGQVVPGQLRMEIASCDGGEYTDSHFPIYSHPRNMLQDDQSVYCTKSNRCNLLLKHVGGMPFTLSKVIVKAPRQGFDAPIQEGLIFVSMEDNNLVDKTSQYEVNWSPRGHRYHRSRLDSHRPSHDYLNSVRSPSRPFESTRFLADPGSSLHPYTEEDFNFDTAVIPGFQVTVDDPSDLDDAGEPPLSPRAWHDDDYSLRSYVDRYRPVYLNNDRNDSRSATPSDLDDFETDPAGEDRFPGDRERFQRSQMEFESTVAHRNRVIDLMRAQQIRDNDEFLGRRSRQGDPDDDHSFSHRPTPGRLRIGSFAPAIGAPDPAHPGDASSRRMTYPDTANSTKHNHSETGAPSTSSNDIIAPHARFFISKSKSSIAIKFDPPISGRYILVKLWAQCPNANIDIQAILPYGYGGPRFFPSVEMR